MTSRQPSGPNSLFGRDQDLDTVIRMLRASDCRLVTLTGPGGIGKTCLSQAAAEQLQVDFDNQVYVTALQSLTQPAQVLVAVAQELGLQPQRNSDLRAALLRFLATRRALLVLDNFEHLLEASSLVAAVLDQAPRVKILVTSREVLNLQQEWVWPVRGIAYPKGEPVIRALDYAAVRMFDTRARRINPAFDVKQELPAVIQICALVEGSPLAIELAAGWLKSLTCADILTELRQDIDILRTRLRDIPEQHRSIRAVFDHSWRMLDAEEQAVLMRLCLFRGSFTREAAQVVAGASLSVLTSLIDKSLLYLTGNGRYQFHELFRQYVDGHLRAETPPAVQVHQALMDYYRSFLAERMENIWGAGQREAIQAVRAELHNLHPLLDQLSSTGDAATARRAAHVLSEVYQFIGAYRQAEIFIRQVMAPLDARGEDHLSVEELRLLAEMANNLGWLYIRLGEFEATARMITRAEALYARHQLPLASGFASDPRIALGELKSIHGDLQAAKALGEAAYTDAHARDDGLNGSIALYVLTNVALAQGDYVQAQAHIATAIHLTRHIGNHWFLAYCLNQQGHIYREQGDYTRAQQQYEESYRIRAAFDDPEGQAVALNHLGTLALLQDNHEHALACFEQSLPMYQRLEDRGGLFTAHNGLGVALTALHNYDRARDHLLQALQVARDVRVESWWLVLCAAAGEFLAATHAVERGLELISLAHQHPESKSATRLRAEICLGRLPEPRTSAHADHDLQDVIRQLENELPSHTWQPPASGATGTAIAQTDLIEPLTERELEVLRMLADGLTNQEIADRLVVAVGTVKSHNYNIFGKLGVSNRGQAAKRARELGLL